MDAAYREAACTDDRLAVDGVDRLRRSRAARRLDAGVLCPRNAVAVQPGQRENLLEDQSELDLAKAGRANAAQLFDYYLGWIKNPTITRHFHLIPNASVGFAKQWGMNVAVEGRKLPRDLLIYAFGAQLGGQSVLTDAQRLAQQSHIPMRNLTLINRQSTYAHNDPAGAYPRNVFFAHLVPFLGSVGRVHSHPRRRDARPVRSHR
jgi:hypothetical protein